METINYKVVITDLSTSSVYIKTIAFPYIDVDEMDARDIAEENDSFVENYIEKVMGLDLDFVNYVILADNDDVMVYTD
jgi:hypothetical protein